MVDGGRRDRLGIRTERVPAPWALTTFGFTERQAAFLVTVALHGGYCLRRQYAAFAGVGYGKNVRDFLDHLVARRVAARITYRADRGHIYHLFARPIYAALQQDDNRNRRHASPALIARKLMLLDYVLSHRDARWYATEREKVDFFEAPNSFRPSLTAWTRRSCSSARSTSTRTIATLRNCASSSRSYGSTDTPANSKNSTWKAFADRPVFALRAPAGNLRLHS